MIGECANCGCNNWGTNPSPCPVVCEGCGAVIDRKTLKPKPAGSACLVCGGISRYKIYKDSSLSRA